MEDIIAVAAHELRLPISHIKGFVTTLRRTDVQWDEQTWREFITEIDLEIDRLIKLVDSLLAARASEADGKQGPDVALTHPATVVERALNRVGVLGKRPLRIDVPSTLPCIQMDASQIERVIVNLLENAIKYSPSGAPIGISARVTRDGELQLSVEDEGPGVPAADREQIFLPFFRNRLARNSIVPGHGLGLAICQSIVLAHGGRIEVTDRPRKGACFSVFLPARVQARNCDRTEQLKDSEGDQANNSRRGRRSTNAQAPVQQSQSQWLRCAGSKRWLRGTETHRGTPVRPAAA